MPRDLVEALIRLGCMALAVKTAELLDVRPNDDQLRAAAESVEKWAYERHGPIEHRTHPHPWEEVTR